MSEDVFGDGIAQCCQEGLSFRTIPLRRESKRLSLMQCLEAREKKHGYVNIANLATKFSQAFETREKIKVRFNTQYHQADKVFGVHSGTVIMTSGARPRFALQTVNKRKVGTAFLVHEQDTIVEVQS